MKITVEAYSGFKANERPSLFVMDDHVYEVQEVLDQWYGPTSVYFKVRAGDGNFYILQYDPAADAWSLESFRQAAAEPPPQP